MPGPKCKELECDKEAGYNFKGQSKRLYCANHKKENMINSRTCIVENCLITAGYNIRGETKRLYCNTHKKKDMINIKNKYCIIDKCKNRGLYGLQNKPKEYCEIHKTTGMVDKLYENSFARHPKAKYWSKRNTLLPKDVFISSSYKFWFDCDTCNHTFSIRLNDLNNGRWCSYCASKLLCKNEECKWCFENSFASHPKSKFWSDKNNISYRNIFKSSNKRCWFKCENNHLFSITLNNVTTGHWCKKCYTVYSKLQIEWLEWLMKKNKIYIQHAKNGGEYKYLNYRADGFCEETNTWYIFQGNYWHMSPDFYKASDINATSRKRALDIWIYDFNRLQKIKEKFKVKILWEHEWNEIKSVSF